MHLSSVKRLGNEWILLDIRFTRESIIQIFKLVAVELAFAVQENDGDPVRARLLTSFVSIDYSTNLLVVLVKLCIRFHIPCRHICVIFSLLTCFFLFSDCFFFGSQTNYTALYRTSFIGLLPLSSVWPLIVFSPPPSPQDHRYPFTYMLIRRDHCLVVNNPGLD